MSWSGRRATWARVAIAVAVALCIPGSRCALAAEPDGSNLSRAHDAYARGAAAYERGDYARAAHEMSAADLLIPDAVTLRVALEAVALADDPVLGTELVARARRDPANAPLVHAALVAAQRFLHRTGRIVVRCDGCLAMIDGAPAPTGEPVVVLPGVHSVSVQRHAGPETRLVSVVVDETEDVIVRARAATPDEPPAAAPRPHGISPVWFVSAAVVSVALGAVTVWSAVDTANEHSTFEGMKCSSTGGSACQALASTGKEAEARTLGFGIATGVAVAGTALLGGLAVRWKTGEQEIEVTTKGPTLQLRVTF